MVGKIVAIDVRPPELGVRVPMAGVQDIVAPKIFGRIADEGCSKDIAFMITHPAVNFMQHYLIEPLQQRGCAAMGLNTRYSGNDTMLLMERVIQDLGAGFKFLRDEGYKRIVFIGNSGGGSIGATYCSQAEKLTVTHTPDGLPIDLYPEDFPQIDGFAIVSGHIGRHLTFGESLDPSVLDERDQFSTDPTLDMFNPDNGPPYDKAWLERYRTAQNTRYQQITDWVLGKLREIETMPEERRLADMPFMVYRTAANPSSLDPTIEPSDRPQGETVWGSAFATNYSPNVLGRFTTLRSYLSHWSPLSIADGPQRLAETTLPVINVTYSADEGCFPTQTKLYSDAAKGRCEDHLLKGARHFPYKQEGGERYIAELAEVLIGWANKL